MDPMLPRITCNRRRSRWTHKIRAWMVVLALGTLTHQVVHSQDIANDAYPSRPLTTAPFENPFVTQEPDAVIARFNSLRTSTADDNQVVVGASAVDTPPLPANAKSASSDEPADMPAADASSQAAPTKPQVAEQPADDAEPKELEPDTTTSLLPAEPSQGNGTFPLELPSGIGGPEKWLSPGGISSALEVLAMLAVVSLAPAILLMTTCFVRITVVLGLLRQALGTQQLPPNQVMTSIALFMTLLIMSPVWSRVVNDAIKPYAAEEISATEAWDAGVQPVRQFMSAQIDRTGNRDDIWLFYKYLPADTPEPSSYDDVPLTVLLPAFMLSELKTAFLIGFQIYLPFLVLDLVVSSITISMGMMMLPPVMISLPFKLLLFVMVDGWHLVVGMLLDSFQTFS
jgi:flagellar biosynthetic protein FliP